MPTKTLAGKQPVRKPAVRKPAAKKAALRRPAAKAAKNVAARAGKPSAKASAADFASLSELATRLGKLELAGLAGRLVQGWRADLEAIAEASRKSYAGLQAIVSRQTAQIREAAGELQSVGKVMTVIGPKDSLHNLDDLARAGLDLALADIRELAELAANSQREAFEIVHRRVTKNIDDVQQLLRK
jgi:phasin family protein